jgi:hypothetical protein
MNKTYNFNTQSYFFNLVFAVAIKPFYINLGREKAYQTSRNYYFSTEVM